METIAVDQHTLHLITTLAEQQHTSEMIVVRQAIRIYAQKTGKKKPKLIQVGKQKPFKPFKAIKMMGAGPTASEMVLQDRAK